MNCQLCQTEMHTWRPQSDPPTFRGLFDHLASCPACSSQFREIMRIDTQLQAIIQGIPAPQTLQAKILAGLHHERKQGLSFVGSWHRWIILPLAAAALLAVFFVSAPFVQEIRLQRQLAALLIQPPQSQLVSSDRAELLKWSAGVVHGPPQLPPELRRVQFRGAAAIQLANHKAVILQMKNEPRASLLVVDGRLPIKSGMTLTATASGTEGVWGDQQRTYVLLFRGNTEETQAYMVKMGIVT
jgi:hypothetical protein